MADERVPELVADMEDQTAACLTRELKIERRRAAEIAKKVVRHITDNWGGQLIYIPKNLLGHVSERDMKIYQEFNGKNHGQLSKKYNLTEQHIYRIVKDVGIRETAKRQTDLFG